MLGGVAGAFHGVGGPGRGAGWGGNAWCSTLGMGPMACVHHEEGDSGVGAAKGRFLRPRGV